MTLRTRILSGMLLIAAVLSVAAVIVVRTTRNNLVGGIDRQIEAALPLRLPSVPPPDALRGRDARIGERLSPMYVGRVGQAGVLETIFEPNITDDPSLPKLDAKTVARRGREGEPFTVGSYGDGADYRALARTNDETGDTVVVAMSLAEVDAAVTRLIAVEVGATSAAVALLAAVAWWVVRLGIRPLKQMTATAAAIASGDLSRRVPQGQASRTEAGELGAALNQMMSNIEGAFALRAESENRLRRFIADASHELRTPVATIRGYAELYRDGGLEHRDELNDAMRRTEDESVRMATLIDDMLLLARLDQGRPLEQEIVDLSVLALDAASDARAFAPGRDITAHTNGPVLVIGDDHRLRQVVSNLVRNALVHTPESSPVTISVRGGDRAVLEVTDAGPGMSQEVAAKAFERFYRADSSRSRRSGGSGLGLSIVHATVAALHGRVELVSNESAGTTARIELPLAPPPPDDE